MKKYYTRVCNFYYGINSQRLINKKKTIPLNGNLKISFDHIEILSRNSNKLIHIKEIKNLPLKLKKKVNKDLKNISKQKKNTIKTASAEVHNKRRIGLSKLFSKNPYHRIDRQKLSRQSSRRCQDIGLPQPPLAVYQ